MIRKKGPLPNLDDPIPYLIGMAKNIIKRYVDKGRIDYRAPESFQEYPDLSANEKFEINDYEKCIESIKLLIKLLPKAQAKIVEDHWLKSKSLSEICKDRNYNSTPTLSSMKSQALKGLRKIIRESDNHHELKFWLKRMEKNNNNGK